MSAPATASRKCSRPASDPLGPVVHELVGSLGEALLALVDRRSAVEHREPF